MQWTSDISRTLADLYARDMGGSTDQLEFSSVLSRFCAQEDLDDETLAHVIEHDSRELLVRGMDVSLERYLNAVPNLADRQEPLDAAVDAALRSRARSPQIDQSAIESLVADYPEFEDSIRQAALISNAICSSDVLLRKMAETVEMGRLSRVVPQDIGPVCSTGEPRYQLRRRLGRGTIGEVYLAIDRELSEEGHPALVAVKILENTRWDQGIKGSRDQGIEDPRSTARSLHPSSLNACRHGDRLRNTIARSRMADEATKARRIDHANVVRVLDRGVSADDEDYIVYEYIDGGDLDDFLRAAQKPGKPPMTQRQAASLMVRIARGVQAAHTAGLIHCDLKPSNILLSRESATGRQREIADRSPDTESMRVTGDSDEVELHARVSDFGIAVRIEESLAEERVISRLDQPVGNLAYMSPEQFRIDEGCLTAASDIYALGGILFTLLTGRYPNGNTVEEVARTHNRLEGRMEPPSPRDVVSEIDCDLDAMCRRAMAIRPQDRYASAGEFADDLESWLRREPLPWTKPSLFRIVKLWAMRRTGLAVCCSILAVTIVLAAVITGHLLRENSRARTAALEADLMLAQSQVDLERQRSETELERLRAEQEQQINRGIQEAARRFSHALALEADTNRTTSQVLPALWSVEHLFRREVMQWKQLEEDISAARFLAVQRFIDDQIAQGRELDLETLLWKTNIAFWLIGGKRHEEAAIMLSRLHEQWTRRLEPDDRWLVKLGIMIRCNDLKRSISDESIATADDDDVRAVLEQIRQDELWLEGTVPGSPLHILTIDTILAAGQTPWLTHDDLPLDEVAERRKRYVSLPRIR